MVDPTPACSRALNLVVSALRAEGHDVFDADIPSPYQALIIASQLLNSDGCNTFRSSFRTGEWSDRGAAQMRFYMNIPRPLKYIYYLWVKYIRRDAIWAGLLQHWLPKSSFQLWKWVSHRDAYKAQWHHYWQHEAKMDFMLTPPNATPALPHDSMHDAVSSCGYTFMFNLVRPPL